MLSASKNGFHVALFAVGLLLLIAIYGKWLMINYGLPFQTHVDESMVLKNPFKLLLNYKDGDFSQSTNLFNWLMLGYFSFIFICGFIIGEWESFTAFQTFMISDSPDLFLYGRILSLVLSCTAHLIMIRLIFTITNKQWERILFSAIILFNPIEVNAVNWIKLEAFSYLACATLLLFAHQYFVLNNKKIFFPFYFLLIVSLTVRIELICFLAGFSIIDFYQNRKQVRHFIGKIGQPYLYGTMAFCLITLYPLKFFTHTPPGHLTTSKTYESAIMADLNWDSILFGIQNSDYYILCLLLLLGPAFVFFVIRVLPRKENGFLVLPFLILAVVLMVYPVKNTHYLMNLSVIIIYGCLLSFKSIPSSGKRIFLLGFMALWIVSFSVEEIYIVGVTGDVRIKAREYVLQNSEPADTIYVDGIFDQIKDKPGRYNLKAEAAREIGSTGLSNDFYAKTLKDNDTRTIITVSDYDPFGGTSYKNVFNNRYDTTVFLLHGPKYYLKIRRSPTQHDPKDKIFFYKFLKNHFSIEKSFSLDYFDPRLEYGNFYYFHGVEIFSKM